MQDAWRPQVIAAVVEDFLVASTGSWSRWNSSYAPMIKDNNLPQWIRDPMAMYNRRRSEPGAINGSRCTANVTGYGTVEYRYPPGTLVDNQFVLNLGMCMAMQRLAESTSDDTLRGQAVGAAMNFEEYRSLSWEGGSRTDAQRALWKMLVRSLCVSAGYFREHGFSRKENWSALPYDTLNPPTVTVTQGEQRILVNLPSQDDLYMRLRRQVGRFCMRSARELGINPKEAEEVANTIAHVFN
jgi:hypothetical protein